MKILLAIFLLGGCCMVTNGQDYGTVNLNFITSLITVSSSQFQRAFEYINEYTSANLRLTQIAATLNLNLQNVPDAAVVLTFVSEIQEYLNTNVATLTKQFSPDNVRNFILHFYNDFLSNLSLNNGTQSEIAQMHQLYLSKILSFNATGCIAKYNAAHLEIYSRVASNFTETIESDISATVGQLESLRQEIRAMITDLVGSLETIIADRTTARSKFDEFIASSGSKIIGQVENWLQQFSTLMKQTQRTIRDGFNQFDAARVSATLAIIHEASACLNAV